MYFRGQKKTAGDVSLSGGIDADGDDDGLSILDTIADESDLLEDLTRRESALAVRRAVEQLTDGREKEVICLRYGLSGEPPQPQREVAQRLGISRSYVSRIEKKALEKLRAAVDPGE